MGKIESISGFGNVTSEIIVRAAKEFGTPVYLYDESVILQKCKEVLEMPNAYGLRVRYAMKANPNRALLQLITGQSLDIDAGSLNEVRRAHMAGVDYSRIMLTSQEVPLNEDRKDLEEMIKSGLKYNVCSLRQLEQIADFASENNIPLSMRVHPGVGSGESSTRNTGDKYSCFGVHLTNIEEAMEFSRQKGVIFDQIHVHIGSGGDPEKWRENVDTELDFVEKYFPDAEIVNFGGGLKEARMPDEIPANMQELGLYVKKMIQEFYKRTGRKLIMEVEPGTYIIANAGYIITMVIDKKETGTNGHKFLVLDGGMEVNTRPLLYGSRHPLYVVLKYGKLLSTETNLSKLYQEKDLRVVVGRCCESGDSQTLDKEGKIIPRLIASPEIGDYVVIGGAGAYCSAMAPFNYNSYQQAPEVLLRENNELQLIRKLQTLRQMTANELSLNQKK